MSSSPAPRLTRNHKPARSFKDHNYREALPSLLKETGGRCAYSLRHEMIAGTNNIEVDHFNPDLRGKRRHDYSNLLPAESVCNGSKLAFWPTEEQRAAGIRLLNPFEEQDFGNHICEDIDSHNLIGMTPTGRFHIIKLKLNAPHFVDERRRRYQMHKEFSGCKLLPKGADNPISAVEALNVYKQQLALMIPMEIPFVRNVDGVWQRIP